MAIPTTSIGYVFHTGASTADKTQFQQIITLDSPGRGAVFAGTTGRQGPYFLYRDTPQNSDVTKTYVIPVPGGTTDVKYEDAEKMQYVWRSKKFVLQGETTFSVMKVVHKKGCVRARVYADGCLAFDAMVFGCGPFRLPSQLMGITIEIELIGTATVYEVHIASSMKELLSNE